MATPGLMNSNQERLNWAGKRRDNLDKQEAWRLPPEPNQLIA
jgi:hypothetical protein